MTSFISQFFKILIISLIFYSCQTRFWVNVNNQRSQCWNSQVNKGVTWQLNGIVTAPPNLVILGCGGVCDAYNGDTPCDQCLPMLCIEKLNASRPAYDLTPAQNPFYNGWTGGNVKLTDPIQGSQLTSLAVANQYCQQSFGSNWVMADHHDGKYISGMNAANHHSTSSPPWNWAMSATGGWNFYAFGNYDEIKKKQDETKCGCEHSFYYRWDATISPPGWVYNSGFNDFCDSCENVPLSAVPQFCFNSTSNLADITLPDYGCFACFCRPCEKLYYWTYSETDNKWIRNPAFDVKYCEKCLSQPYIYNDICHWDNPFFSPAADAPCQGCWCDSCDKWRAFQKQNNPAGQLVTKEDTSQAALDRCKKCPNAPYCFYSTADFLNSKFDFGCICNANINAQYNCKNWMYLTQTAGAWQSMVDATPCNQCNSANPPALCQPPGTTFAQISQNTSLKEACLCGD